jgi:LacI family transcriptional regulator, repressor for deo operon, udp, cdd, tsx, nupC, and nupG
MTKKALSLRDIARLAGTSPATVSRTLSGKGPVSDELAARVLRVVRETGFSVNRAASTLSRQQRGRNGLIHNAIALIEYTEDITPPISQWQRGLGIESIDAVCNRGILAAAEEEGLDVSMCLLPLDVFAANDAPEKLRNLSVDGILASSLRGVDPICIKAAAPTVVYRSRPVANCCCPVVESDNELGIWTAVKHLVDLGHRRLMFLSRDMASDSRHLSYMDRRNAFEIAVNQLGGSGTVVAAEHSDDIPLARKIVGMSPAERPTALIFSNDIHASEMANHLRASGLNIPEDISIVGFDGTSVGDAHVSPITTWRVDWREVGALALRTLVATIRGEPVAARSLVGGELVDGGTTGPAPVGGGRDRQVAASEVMSA